MERACRAFLLNQPQIHTINNYLSRSAIYLIDTDRSIIISSSICNFRYLLAYDTKTIRSSQLQQLYRYHTTIVIKHNAVDSGDNGLDGDPAVRGPGFGVGNLHENVGTVHQPARDRSVLSVATGLHHPNDLVQRGVGLLDDVFDVRHLGKYRCDSHQSGRLQRSPDPLQDPRGRPHHDGCDRAHARGTRVRRGQRAMGPLAPQLG